MSKWLAVVFVLAMPGVAMATTYARGSEKVVAIGEAIQQLEALVAEKPDLATAWHDLGCIHETAYETAPDAVTMARGSGEEDETPRAMIGLPPMRMAKRMTTVPAQRAEHLAKAVRALRRAAELEPENKTFAFSLGYTYNECRDRFPQKAWPFTETEFDKKAAEEGGNAAFWEALALEQLRKCVPATLPKDAMEMRMAQDPESQLPAHLLREILLRRATPTDEEKAELARLENLPKMIGYRPMAAGDTPLPNPPADLAAIYPLAPDGLETAEIYLRAVDATLQTMAYEELPIIGSSMERNKDSEPLSPETLALAGECVGFHATTYQLIHEGNQRRECRYPVDLTRGQEIELSYLAPLRQLSRLLALKALHAAETGDGDTAAAAILDNFKLGESLRREPLVISQLVRLAVQGIAVDSLRQVLNRVELSNSAMSDIAEALKEAEGMEPLQYALAGEQSGMLITLANEPKRRQEQLEAMKEHYGGKLPPDFAEMSAHQPPVPEPQEVKEMFAALHDALDLPFAEAKAQMEAATTEGAVMLPTLGRAYVAFVRAHAYLRNAQGALAVEKYWRAHGVAPASMADLVPVYLREPVLDPFDGAPLRIRDNGGGYTVYSVGDNGTDDDGRKGNVRPDLDIGFTVGNSGEEETPEAEAGVPTDASAGAAKSKGKQLVELLGI